MVLKLLCPAAPPSASPPGSSGSVSLRSSKEKNYQRSNQINSRKRRRCWRFLYAGVTGACEGMRSLTQQADGQQEDAGHTQAEEHGEQQANV